MDIVYSIKKVIEKDERIIFAYLYGSILENKTYRDIDIGIYLAEGYDFFRTSSDLQIALFHETGISPDLFDIQVINNASSLIYLQRVLNGKLLVDKNRDVRGDFIESFSMNYRESEGILSEAYS